MMEVESMVVSTEEISGQMPDPTRGEAVMEVNILNTCIFVESSMSSYMNSC